MKSKNDAVQVTVDSAENARKAHGSNDSGRKVLWQSIRPETGTYHRQNKLDKLAAARES